MKNRVLVMAAALAAIGPGGVATSLRVAQPSLDGIFSEPRSTMWLGLSRVQRSKRRVAMDKREARKKRNRVLP